MKKQLLLFILTLLPMLAMADESGSCGDNVTYTFVSSTGTLTIQGNGAIYNYNNITVPWNSYKYKIKTIIIDNSVTSIGSDAFRGCSGLTSVTIGNSVTSIGSSVFEGCSGLTSITIPNSVTSIGNEAFSACYGLTSVTIPNSVMSIGVNPFSECSGLNSIIIEPDNLKYDSRNNCNAIINSSNNTLITGCKSTVIPNSVTSIGEKAFSYCPDLTSITIPNSVTSIGSYAFSSCSGLTSITISNSVRSIGSWAFLGCSGLTSVSIPNSVTSISEYTFSDCSGLTSVNIPNSVKIIGAYAFLCCSSLTSITIGNTVTSIGRQAFYGCSRLASVEFHCPQIGSWFKGMTSIKEVIIGNEVTSIGSDAFKDCSGLTSITIPNSVTSIGSEAFWRCSGLTSVTIGNSVTSIGDYAFYGCTNLTSVTIPSSVMSIGSYAFRNCFYLTSITIPNSLVSIGIYAFLNCSNLQKVIVPDIAAWCGISFADNSANPLSYAHHIYSDENTEIKELVIPDGVTSIGSRTFYSCSGLTSITIPNSVTSIGSSVFEGCSGLTSITIPNSVTSIGSSVFEGCSGLTSITIPNSVTSIGERAFYDCSGLTSVTIGNSVTSIGNYAFYGCTSMSEMYCYAQNVPAGNNIFNNSNYKNATLYVPKKSLEAYRGAAQWKDFGTITRIVLPSHILKYVVDGEDYKVYEVEEETEITPEPIPTKEGYTFSGWSEIPETMPAYDVTVTGTFSINKYKLTYKVDRVEYKVYEIAEGATITPEPAPTKEGYTFSGWSEIPETMPAHDVTVTGTFSINKYKLTYKVDGVEYKRYELEYGAEITPEPAPTKEGYTFSGWSEIPETMPAYDVTVTGSFTVNQYLITYMIGDEVYQKEYVDYGAKIVLPNVPEREGYSFAWIDAPEKMPAHDITINGAYTSGMWGVSNDDATTNTYTISGYKTDKPRRGVNIIRMSDGTTRKVVVK